MSHLSLSQGSLTIPAGTLPVPSALTFRVVGSRGTQSATAVQQVNVIAGEPPNVQILLVSSDHPAAPDGALVVISSRRIVLEGSAFATTSATTCSALAPAAGATGEVVCVHRNHIVIT